MFGFLSQQSCRYPYLDIQQGPSQKSDAFWSIAPLAWLIFQFGSKSDLHVDLLKVMVLMIQKQLFTINEPCLLFKVP